MLNIAIDWTPNAKDILAYCPRELLSWLTDETSLTVRLKQALGEQFKFQILKQFAAEMTDASPDIVKPKQLIIREVSLGTHAQPMLYGRTILTTNLLAAYPELTHKPLGEVIFKDGSLKRTPFEFALLTPSSQEYAWLSPWLVQDLQAALAATRSRYWARRSCFEFANEMIAVTEIFLTTLP